MDLSEKYIEMCRKAGEIQELMAGSKTEVKIVSEFGDIDIDSLGDYYTKDSICIPKHDQLQAMIDNDFINLIYIVYDFSRDALYEDDGNNLRFETMEQLLLGFVMKEKYDKYWNNNNWIERYEGY